MLLENIEYRDVLKAYADASLLTDQERLTLVRKKLIGAQALLTLRNLSLHKKVDLELEQSLIDYLKVDQITDIIKNTRLEIKEFNLICNEIKTEMGEITYSKLEREVYNDICVSNEEDRQNIVRKKFVSTQSLLIIRNVFLNKKIGFELNQSSNDYLTVKLMTNIVKKTRAEIKEFHEICKQIQVEMGKVSYSALEKEVYFETCKIINK